VKTAESGVEYIRSKTNKKIFRLLHDCCFPFLYLLNLKVSKLKSDGGKKGRNHSDIYTGNLPYCVGSVSGAKQ
jgi:hypothetical protein